MKWENRVAKVTPPGGVTLATILVHREEVIKIMGNYVFRELEYNYCQY